MKKLYDSHHRELKPIHEAHEPIPGDIEARFTKPKEAQSLFQVFVEIKGEENPTAVSPRMLKPYCEEVLAAFNRSIIDGKQSKCSNAFIAHAA